MTNTARINVTYAPEFIKKFLQDYYKVETIELTIIEALRASVLFSLNQEQTETWLNYWAIQYAEDVSDSAFENGQHSMQLY